VTSTSQTVCRAREGGNLQAINDLQNEVLTRE
jgi:hypothetical protein